MTGQGGRLHESTGLCVRCRGLLLLSFLRGSQALSGYYLRRCVGL